MPALLVRLGGFLRLLGVLDQVPFAIEFWTDFVSNMNVELRNTGNRVRKLIGKPAFLTIADCESEARRIHLTDRVSGHHQQRVPQPDGFSHKLVNHMNLKEMIGNDLNPTNHMTSPPMDLDDELARLRTMLADLRTLNGDVSRLRADHDRYKEALTEIGQITTDHRAAFLASNALNP